MKPFLFALLFQFLPVPPRSALENPAILLPPIPQKVKKDYDKLWARFLAGKQDAKLVKDLDKFVARQQNLDAPLIVEAYIDLSQRKDLPAVQKFERVLALNPNNRIALYYLAELAFARLEYARASDFYAKLLAVDSTRTDVEPKRQKAVLLATENLLRSAERAEADNRLADAEGLFKQALTVAPREPVFHARLAQLLAREGKWDEALVHYRNQMEFGGGIEVEKNIAEALTKLGRADEAREVLDLYRKQGDPGQNRETELEDLGRWGKDLEAFRAIKASSTLTREQLAAIIVRYFPQVTELHQTPQIVTDIQDSWAGPEIQTMVGTGLIDPLPNHTFQPATGITRGELALSMARLIRVLGVSVSTPSPIPVSDVAASDALFRDVQLVVGLELMALDNSGNFNVRGDVSGEEAVRAAERLVQRERQRLQAPTGRNNHEMPGPKGA